MGLVIPQELEIKWSTTSRDHYINLGYKYTKVGDYFKVNVLDLSHGSTVRVNVKCDFCFDVVQTPYRAVLKLKSDKYCCPNCLKHKKKVKDNDGNLMFIDIPYRNRNWLFNEYITLNRDASSIADECGINPRTLREWISLLNIPDKHEYRKSKLNNDTLIDLYFNKMLSTVEIGELYDLSDYTVAIMIRECGYEIPSRSELSKRYYYEKGGREKAYKIANKLENRIKSSCCQRGISLKDFKGFVKSNNDLQRKNVKYAYWRNSVFERDNYTCQCCNKYGGKLNAHHIKNFLDNEGLRLDIDNGITLCEECHLVKYPNSFHSIYGQRNNTKEQLDEYILNRKLGIVI